MSGLARLSRPRLRARTRLTLWYVALLASSLIILGSTALWVIERQLRSSFDETLLSRVSAIESDLNHDDGRFAVEDAREAEALGLNLDVVRIWDRGGKLVYAREGTTRLPPTATLPPPADLVEANRFSDGRLADGRSVRLVTLAVGDRGRVVGFVQAGRATDEVEQILGRLRLLGAGGLVIALLFAWAGGSFLAGRALTPIDRITRAAERISADDLSRRLDLRLPDDELGRLARAFDGMIARLEAAFARQRRFTADASHELRTPLGVIRAQADVALRQPREPAHYRRVLESIRDETARLGRVADSLLVLARADAGETIPLRPLDVQDLVAEAGARVAPRARERGVHLALRLDECPPLSGDAAWLTQLVLNLLDNALRHTPAGGRVTLRVGTSDGGARVQVTDTGEGIAPGHLPYLFERFYRADHARGRATGGAGLGLAICAWIAEAHGGRLEVESEVGHGTTFTLWLPAESHQAADRVGAPGTSRPVEDSVTPPIRAHAG